MVYDKYPDMVGSTTVEYDFDIKILPSTRSEEKNLWIFSIDAASCRERLQKVWNNSTNAIKDVPWWIITSISIYHTGE